MINSPEFQTELNFSDCEKAFQEISRHLETACIQLYKERLIGMCYFGSVARQVVRPDSDIDFLLLVDPLPNGRGARIKEFEKAEQLLLDLIYAWYNRGVITALSPILKTPHEMEIGSLLLCEIARDAKIVFDPTGRLTGSLGAFNQRLIRAGARRFGGGGSGYWLLSPEGRPSGGIVI